MYNKYIKNIGVEIMTENELNKIKEMPKAVLHLHLDGSLRPETVYKWLKEQGKDTLSLYFGQNKHSDKKSYQKRREIS